MLIITGMLDGKMRDQEAVDPKDLMRLLKVPPMGKYAEFRLASNRVKKDQSGQTTHARGLSLDPAYVLELPTGTLQIRYTRGRRKENQQWVYDTYRMQDFRGLSLAFADGQQIEKYVWYWLHKWQGTNPYRPSGATVAFVYFDREADASAKLVRTVMLGEVTNEILQMDTEGLRVRAKGIRYRIGAQEHVVASIDNMGEAELRGALIERAVQHGQPFLEAWRNSANTLQGMVRHAVDEGILRLREQLHGSYWAWNTGDERMDTPITTIRKGQDPFSALLDAFVDRHSDLVPVLQAAINRRRVDALGLDEQLTITPHEELGMDAIKGLGHAKILDQMLLHDLIGLDRKTGTVWFLQNGEEVDSPIFTATDKARWKDELLAALAKPEYKPARQAMAMRLYNHLKPSGSTEATEPELAGAEGGKPNKK